MDLQFREPSCKEELKALFRLRHTVYSQDPVLHSMIPNRLTNIDLNTYDLNALHFGAFKDNEPIAYIRVAMDCGTHFTNWVEEIAHEMEIETGFSELKYPFQNYYPDPEWSNNFVQSLGGRKIGEVGRLAIHKDYRHTGLFPRFMQSFISYCRDEHALSTGFGSCSLPLEQFYVKIGFSRVEGCKPFAVKGLPEAVIVRFDQELV